MKIYGVEIELTEPMLGTVAKNPEIYKTFIESKKPPEIGENESETVPVDERSGWTGFHEDKQGIFIYDYLFKGFLKYAANAMKEEIGIKALRKKVVDYVFVYPRRIHIPGGLDGTVEGAGNGGFPSLMKPDDNLERPLQGMTARGPRVSLARSDVINAGRKFKVEVRVLRESVISEKTLQAILDYGQYQGLGQWRTGGYGRFAYTLSEVK